MSLKKKPGEAIAAFRQAISIRPDFSDAWFNMANAMKEAGLLDEAIETYRKAISLQPNAPAIYWGLALALDCPR